MNIVVKTIPHTAQRYDTVGDWSFKEDGTLEILVSECGDWRYEFLVAMHEAIEAALCKQRGIRESVVTNFDMAFEASRKIDDTSEPGEQKNAPYHKEHVFASDMELFLAHEFGLEWELYEKSLAGLEYKIDRSQFTKKP